MALIDFAAFAYYPALQSSEGEYMGYRNLSEDDKSAILPIFEIGQRKNEPNLTGTIEQLKGTISERPFILDLSKDPAPPAFVPKDDPNPEKTAALQKSQHSYNAQLVALLDQTDGFANWRGLVSQFPNCVPMLQFTDADNQAINILRQGAQMAFSGFESLAIRISPDSAQTIYPVLAQLMAILPSPDRLLVVVDCGQGRIQRPEKAEFAKKVITELLAVVDVAQQAEIRAVCLTNSFPNASHDNLKEFQSFDWDLWEEASSIFPFQFGDYASINRRRKSTTYVPGDWRATVAYPLDRGWLIYRHPDASDPKGWIDGAKAVIAHPSYQPGLETWGGELLVKAAAGSIDDVASARFWHAAKVNMHIHRQVRYAGTVVWGEGTD